MNRLFFTMWILSFFLLFSCKSSSPSSAICDSWPAQTALIRELSDKGELAVALAAAHHFQDSIDKSCDDTIIKALAAIQLADAQTWYSLFYRRGFDTAGMYAAALQRFKGSNDSIVARIDNTVGFYYYVISLLNNTNRIDSAIPRLRNAIALYTSSGREKEAAYAYFNLGLCFQNNPDTTLNSIDTAELYFRASYALSDKLGDQRTNSYATRHLAAVHMDRKQYDSALHYAFRSYESREAIGLQFVQPYSLLLIGDIFKFTNADSAIRYHQLAAGYADRLNNAAGITAAYIALGDDYLAANDIVKAKQQYEQAATKTAALGYTEGHATAMKKIAELPHH
jgi:tetratricopeptide (TPR) repeat protein